MMVFAHPDAHTFEGITDIISQFITLICRRRGEVRTAIMEKQLAILISYEKKKFTLNISSRSILSPPNPGLYPHRRPLIESHAPHP